MVPVQIKGCSMSRRCSSCTLQTVPSHWQSLRFLQVAVGAFLQFESHCFNQSRCISSVSHSFLCFNKQRSNRTVLASSRYIPQLAVRTFLPTCSHYILQSSHSIKLAQTARELNNESEHANLCFNREKARKQEPLQ